MAEHVARLRRLVGHARRDTAFFRGRLSGVGRASFIHGVSGLLARVPPVRASDLAAQKVRTGDPYSGRLAKGRVPLVTVQLDYAEETHLYVGLDRGDLKRYAAVLRRCLALLGLGPGDVVAFYDYGTSPTVYLASACYTPYLTQGAADALGCTVICNDGVPNMGHRAVDLVKYVRPRYLFVRPECVQPFVAAAEADGDRIERYLQGLVATCNEGPFDPRLPEMVQQRLGLPLYWMPRSDLALFMAQECPECRLVHTWRDVYTIEVLTSDSLEPVPEGQMGVLAITSLFARVCPAIRVLTQIQARVVPGGCPRGPEDIRLCL